MSGWKKLFRAVGVAAKAYAKSMKSRSKATQRTASSEQFEEQRRDNLIRIVVDSINIINKTKNQKTAIDRGALATEKLKELKADFPNIDVHEAEDALAQAIAMSALTSSLKASLGPSENIVTQSTHGVIAVLKGWRKMGIEKYNWEAAGGTCETCQRNADSGPYLVADGISGKTPVPPSHGKCRCTITAVVE